MISINTNLSSLVAQNSMKSATNKLNTAIERMSTGFKINHAKDNAANYSINTNMQTRMGALRVAEDNTMQAMEMMSTTTEALSQVNDKLSRMRALAVQSLNGTYGGKSLDAIKAEADALLTEINRINNNAEYDGIKLFSTGKADVTNSAKELELNEQGFLKEVEKVDTTAMTALSSMADDETLAVGEYTISNEYELIQLEQMASKGLITTGSTFVLTADIDISSYCKSKKDAGGWTPMKLNGSFINGNGHSIKGLYINRKQDYQAFCYSAGEVKNLKLEDVNITGYSLTGAIAASGAKVENCSVTGEITGRRNVGGIVGGYFSGYAKYCYVDADIKGENLVGGIFGYANYASVQNCFAKGSVTGENYVGGILGSGDGVKGSKSSMDVKGVENVGGITGNSYQALIGDYFNGTVQGDTYVGGIVGSIRSYSIEDCLMEGLVIGSNSSGLILGCNTSGSTTVKNSTYYRGKSNIKEVVGDLNNVTIENITDITVPCEYRFQIGVTGDDKTSSLFYTTYIDFKELKELLDTGINSEQCLAKIDELVNVVSLKQTELGTMENRLESILDEISIQYENLASSRSTIKDADIAEVSSEYIRQQILQQASATLLATANQTPSIALQLI